MKKDPKKNAKAIEQGPQKIAAAEKHIADVENVVTYANAPSKDIVDSFVEAYSDDKNEYYKFARMMGSKIMDTYYPGIKPKEIKPECLNHNLQQYVGIIFNMFLPAMSRLVDYSEASVTELEKIESVEDEKNA